jgi:hypothetical protein
MGVDAEQMPKEGGGIQMIELKVIPATPHPKMKNACDGAIEVYSKSEADKVIAGWEMKLAAAKLVLRLNEPKALYSNLDTMSRLNHKIDVVERRELHQKYKRCLAMSMRCRSRACFYDTMREDSSYWAWKSDNAYKWHKRWLELANKFKEAK